MSEDKFNYPRNKTINCKYIIQEKLGGGFEGEVYRFIEKHSGIERTAKFIYPKKNLRNHAATRYAKL